MTFHTHTHEVFMVILQIILPCFSWDRRVADRVAWYEYINIYIYNGYIFSR